MISGRDMEYEYSTRSPVQSDSPKHLRLAAACSRQIQQAGLRMSTEHWPV